MRCDEREQEGILGVVVVESFLVNLAAGEEHAARHHACFLISEHVGVD